MRVAVRVLTWFYELCVTGGSKYKIYNIYSLDMFKDKIMVVLTTNGGLFTLIPLISIPSV